MGILIAKWLVCVFLFVVGCIALAMAAIIMDESTPSVGESFMQLAFMVIGVFLWVASWLMFVEF